jgi:RNA polymerase sigma-70 factor, ECF subfamily
MATEPTSGSTGFVASFRIESRCRKIEQKLPHRPSQVQALHGRSGRGSHEWRTHVGLSGGLRPGPAAAFGPLNGLVVDLRAPSGSADWGVLRIDVSLGNGLRVGARRRILRVTVGRGPTTAAWRGWGVDRGLVQRAQRGEEAAFASIALEIGDRLHGVARHVLRDPDLAADAVQQALIDIWRKLPQLRDPDLLLPWAYRIVMRAAYAEAGRRSRWRIEAMGQGFEANASRADTSGSLADRDELERGFARLSLEHRSVLVLKHYAGLNNAEIGVALQISEGTVRSRLYYGLEALRGALAVARQAVP